MTQPAFSVPPLPRRLSDLAPLTARTALAMREKLLGATHPDVALTFANLAVITDALGTRAEADALYNRALLISTLDLAHHTHAARPPGRTI